MYEQIVIYITN